jgi:hypothetical protein
MRRKSYKEEDREIGEWKEKYWGQMKGESEVREITVDGRKYTGMVKLAYSKHIA